MLNDYNIHRFNLITTENNHSKILLKKKKLYTRFVTLKTSVSGLDRATLYHLEEQPLTSQKCVIPELNLTTTFPDHIKIVGTNRDIRSKSK